MSKVIRVLGICGSLRAKSCNMGLLRCAQKNMPAGSELVIADISALPFYNADVTEKPVSAVKLIEEATAADAFVLACPEYNYSMAPALKNALDWLSREPDNAALNDKAAAIVGAGGGMGTSRAQYHLRQTCVYLNLHLLNKPEFFSNAFAGGFDADGNLTDETLVGQIRTQMQALVDFTHRLARH